MATIRELVVRMGVEVDTTPIKRFNSAIKDAKKNLANIGGIKIGGIASGFKKGLTDAANSLDSDEVRNRFRGRIQGFKRFIKKAFLAVAATITATIAGAFMSFTAFASDERAIIRLRTQLTRIPGEFEKTRDLINQITGDNVLGKFVKKIDLLNAASLSESIVTLPELFRETAGLAVKISSIFGEDFTVGDVSSGFAQFVKSGTNLDFIQKLGFKTAQELEVLQKAGTEVTEIGQQQRLNLLRRLISQNIERFDENFIEFQKTSASSLDKASVSVDNFTKIVGEKSGVFTVAVDTVSKALDNLTINIKEQDSVIGGINSAAKESFNAIKNNVVSAISQDSNTQQQFFGPPGAQFQPSTVGGGRGSIINNNPSTVNNISVSVTGGNTNSETARAVAAEIQKQAGDVTQQSKRNLIIRGQNQVIE